MEDKLKELFEKISQSIAEQQWAQELKAKWDELDLQSKLYLKMAGALGAVVLVLFAIFNSVWSVYKLKQELTDKRNLLTFIQNSTDEQRRLQDSLPPTALRTGLGAGLTGSSGATKESGPWSTYFEGIAAGAGVEKGNLTISPEKPGTASDQAKESLFDLDLKHVNIKQVVNLAVSLENGQRPTKIRNLTINTKSDPTGFMDATLAVSGFTLLVNNK